MTQYTFNFKEDFEMPAGNYFPVGATLKFNKDAFGLTYNVFPNPKTKTIRVNLNIINFATDSNIWDVYAWLITEQGFPTDVVINQDEINKYEVTLQTLTNQLAILNDELTGLQNQKVLLQNEVNALQAQYDALEDKTTPEATALLQQITEKNTEIAIVEDSIVYKNNEITNKQNEINSLVRPQPVYEYVNKYSDVLQYFNNDGSLTEDGIVWAKTIKLFGKPISDYII
jgi:hypothetical protein